MAVDCMTVGATDGIKEKEMKKRKIFFIAFMFGLFQGIMPVIGYFIGFSFQKQLEKYIPWIAFTLLSILGIKNIIEWIKDKVKEKKGIQREEKEKSLTFITILLQALATSIDALSIGFVYLNYSIANALLVFLIIGVITFILSVGAIFLGKFVGKFLEKWASLIAGFVFIAIGVKILLEGIL